MTSTSSRHDRRIALLITLMLFAGYMLNFMDRAAFGTLAVLVRADLGLSPSQLGLAFGAFSAGYMLFGMIAGWWVDRLDVQRLLWIVVMTWSILCGSIAGVTGLWTLMAARFLFGAAESPWFPATVKMAARIFPSHRLAGSFAVIQAGAALGGAVAGPLSTQLALRIGWQGAFLTIAALGLIWAILWCVLMAYQRARGSPQSDSVETAPQRLPAPPERGLIATFGGLLTNRPVVAIILSFATTGYLQSFFATWFPSYLSATLGFSLEQLGIGGSLPWLAGLVATLLGGYVSDGIASRTADPIAARKMIVVLALGATALSVTAIAFVSSGIAAVSLISLAMACCAFGGANYFVLLIPLAGMRDLGAATALALVSGNFAGTLAPTLSGYVIEYTGSYQATFFILGAVMLSGALAPLLLLRPSEYGSKHSPDALPS